jgi:pyruvate/2-oxoglutarate dehydrogenase complex dihydrolipoamide dehydrogenase (E3) component
MVASARVAYLARRGALYGVHTGPISLDLQAVRERKQGMVEGARNNFKSRITAVQGLDLDLLRGEAHFSAPKTLEVSIADGETREITAPLIFIDTGARPKQLTLKVSRTVQARMMLNDRDLAAETAKNLSELQPNIAATND